MIRVAVLILAVALSGCAAGPAQVRVGFDRDGETTVTAQGAADRATRRRVTADDPVRVASVSKLVVALGVMRLVEAGKLDLDRDVSDLLGWRLRNPAFPDVPITLRLLLSHRTSLTDGNDYAIPLGQTLRETIASPKAWDPAHAPGTWFAYTNLNFPVVASVIERATGERFDLAMRHLVLAPLELDACYNWAACSAPAVARGVVLYDAVGPVRKDDAASRVGCPVNTTAGCDLSGYRLGDNGALFSPQGGLRISMRDLAKIGRMLLADGGDFLTPQSIATLSAPAWTFDGSNGDTSQGFYCTYGLAVTTLVTAHDGCRDDLFGDRVARIGHAGEAYGVRSGLWIDRASGTGVAFFAVAVPDKGAKGRHSAFTRAEERLARP